MSVEMDTLIGRRGDYSVTKWADGAVVCVAVAVAVRFVLQDQTLQAKSQACSVLDDEVASKDDVEER